MKNRKFCTLPGLELRPLNCPGRGQSLYHVNIQQVLAAITQHPQTENVPIPIAVAVPLVFMHVIYVYKKLSLFLASLSVCLCPSLVPEWLDEFIYIRMADNLTTICGSFV
jgi:hypothetical protein